MVLPIWARWGARLHTHPKPQEPWLDEGWGPDSRPSEPRQREVRPPWFNKAVLSSKCTLSFKAPDQPLRGVLSSPTFDK